MKKLTARQAQVLAFIEQRIREAGFPPTLREIGSELGIKSTNGVNDHLKALEDKGYIKRHSNRSRGLSLCAQGSAVPSLAGLGHAVEVPLLGRVAAGQPILAEEQAEGSVTVDSFLIGDATRVYALRVVGDSMIDDGIFDGDFVFVRKQAHAERGAIVVAMIDGEATVKHFYLERDHVRFEPANARYAAIVVPKNAFRETQILGTVVGVYRRM